MHEEVVGRGGGYSVRAGDMGGYAAYVDNTVRGANEFYRKFGSTTAFDPASLDVSVRDGSSMSLQLLMAAYGG
jgi:hypothetical protein